MRQTPVNNYLEEISTELPEELYGNLSDAIYETVCEFDEDVAQLKAENAKLRELIGMLGNVCDGTSEVCEYCKNYSATNDECMMLKQMHELGIEVDE